MKRTGTESPPSPSAASVSSGGGIGVNWGWGLPIALIAVLGFLLSGKVERSHESWISLDDGVLKPWVRGQSPAVEEPVPLPFNRIRQTASRPVEQAPPADWTASSPRSSFGPTRPTAHSQTDPGPATTPHPFAAPPQAESATDDPFANPRPQSDAASSARRFRADDPHRDGADRSPRSVPQALFDSQEPTPARPAAPAATESTDPFALPENSTPSAGDSAGLNAPGAVEEREPQPSAALMPVQAAELLEPSQPDSPGEPRLVPGDIQPVAGEQATEATVAEPDPFASNIPAAMPIESPAAPLPATDPLPPLEPTPFPAEPLTPPTDIQIEPTPSFPPPSPPVSPIGTPKFPESRPVPTERPAAGHPAHGARTPQQRGVYSPSPVTSPGPSAATSAIDDEPEDDVYQVQSGDNYWTISRRFYGTARFFGALAEYNRHRISDPEKMRPGMYVLVPPVDILHQRYPELTGGGRGGPTNPEELIEGFFVDAAGQPLYRVGKGITLTDIAQRHLGRATRWVDIYRLNKDRIPDVKTLKIGAVLVLPPDASQVQLAPAE